METVTSRDGTTISYWRSGQGSPLLLVHGALSDRSTWMLIQPALAERFTVYAMNRRGREGSGPSLEHELAREFEDVVAVVDAIGEPVHLLGHSGGALCAMGATLLTDLLRSLILYEPPDVNTIPNAKRLRELIQELIDKGRAEDAALTFLRTGPGVPEEDIERLKQSPIWPRIVALAPTLPTELDAIIGYELETSRFAALNIPLLLLVGSESPQRLRALSDDLARIVPNAQVRELVGQQHGAHIDAPELFVSEVVKFLERV
ncbi:MAG: alpha/beta hydrolase [Chloroflexi bacterium]|nr:alpha/beta hydrolase [Chloroflexota bacterium]